MSPKVLLAICNTILVVFISVLYLVLRFVAAEYGLVALYVTGFCTIIVLYLLVKLLPDQNDITYGRGPARKSD